QPVGMLVLHVPLYALRTELAPIEREILARLEPDDLVILDLEIDAALLPAEAAVRRDQLVRHFAILPAARRHKVRRRAVLSLELFYCQRRVRHRKILLQSQSKQSACGTIATGGEDTCPIHV